MNLPYLIYTTNLFTLTLQFWKIYNDHIFCPFSAISIIFIVILNINRIYKVIIHLTPISDAQSD